MINTSFTLYQAYFSTPTHVLCFHLLEFQKLLETSSKTHLENAKDLEIDKGRKKGWNEDEFTSGILVFLLGFGWHTERVRNVREIERVVCVCVYVVLLLLFCCYVHRRIKEK